MINKNISPDAAASGDGFLQGTECCCYQLQYTAQAQQHRADGIERAACVELLFFTSRESGFGQVDVQYVQKGAGKFGIVTACLQ